MAQLRAILLERYDARDVLLTDSGTSALVLALRAVVPAGGTVAYPGYACIDLTAAAIRAGVRVRLYDIDPDTLSPNLDSLRETMARGVDAVVVAHLYGYPADVAAVRDLAARDGIPVIEDAAQAAGGRLRGERLGALADVSVLSFGRGKGTTAGSGGAMLVRTAGLASWTRVALASLAAERRGARQVVNLAAQWILTNPLLYRLPASIPALRLGEMVYHPAGEPRRISAGAKAILPTALSMDDTEMASRRLRALELLICLKQAAGLRAVRSVEGGEPGYLRFACIDSGGAKVPAPSLGVLRGYPLTLEQHEQLKANLIPGERSGKGATFLRDRLFTLPTHSRIGSDDLASLAAWAGVPQSVPMSSVSFA